VENALAQIRKPALVVAIQSDVLFPPEEQYFMARYLPEAQVETIESLYGHDGFLIEYDKIAPLVQTLLERNWTTPATKKASDTKQETRPSAGSALPGSERI
jgi:homoserine acetyltransferase